MVAYKLRINPMAILDILAIKAYIAEDNPDAANQIGITIYTKIEGEYVSIYRVLNGVQNYLAILIAEDLPKN